MGIVWLLVLLVTGFASVDLVLTLPKANGAPQQAALAAMEAAIVVSAYVAARAIEGVLRSYEWIGRRRPPET